MYYFNHSLWFGKNYDLLFLLSFCSLLLFLLIWVRPPEASELQTVHCIVRNVIDVLHGCWAEDVHLCLGGFGTRGPLFGCFWTPGLLGGPWTLGPWFPGFGGLWRKYKWFTPFKFGSSTLTILNSLVILQYYVYFTIVKYVKVTSSMVTDYLTFCKMRCAHRRML